MSGSPQVAGPSVLRGRGHPGGLGTHRVRPLWTDPSAKCWTSPEEEGGRIPPGLNLGWGLGEEQ